MAEYLMSLADRIREAIKHSGKIPARIAEETGFSPGAVTQWLTGQTKSLKAETAAALERATGYRATWLVTGRGPKMFDQNPNVGTVPFSSTAMIPLISFVQAGTWVDVEDPYQVGGAEEWLTTDQSLSQVAFALEIRGDSMLPEFKPGDRIIVDPAIAPQPGDFVVAKNGNGATFKKYRPRGSTADGEPIFELVPLNDDYATMRSDEVPIQIIGTMVEHRKYRKTR